MKIACINVDVDPLICYYAIHGIETSGISEDPIYINGIRRFIELFDKKFGIKTVIVNPVKPQLWQNLETKASLDETGLKSDDILITE